MDYVYSSNGSRSEHVVYFLDDKEDMKYLRNHSRHIDDEILEEIQIFNHLEEIIEEYILGALYHEMVAMSSPQTLISHYEPDLFMSKYSFSNNTFCSWGIYKFGDWMLYGDKEYGSTKTLDYWRCN